jgi:serine/threonine kinase 32
MPWKPNNYNLLSFLMCVFGHSLMLGHTLTDCLQMKQANFDVTHELDEFLMLEKPLTHTKRKANTDLDKLKPELRHLEEKCALFSPLHIFPDVICSFTVYDFSRSKRISYYPHNQPIVPIGTESANTDPTVVLSSTDSVVPNATVVDRSQAGTPVNPPTITAPEFH